MKIIKDTGGEYITPLDEVKDRYEDVLTMRDWRWLHTMSYDISGKRYVYLWHLRYLLVIIRRKLNPYDVNFEEITHCYICHTILLPDDEAYSDINTGWVLCDVHSEFNEDTSNYETCIP